ncbi:putative transposase rhodnius neglectus [Trichonephila clavipes]|nr:putative transposase rhodnius neglectus [Trichonephila clavipes]
MKLDSDPLSSNALNKNEPPSLSYSKTFAVETSSVENKAKPGGPSKLTSRAKRMIVRSATNKPMTSAQNIANELLSSYNVSVPAQTVRNVLHITGLKARTPRKKPYISEVNRKRRLEFALKYKNKPMDFWKKIIISDESKFEIFTPPSIRKNESRFNLWDYDGRICVRRYAGERYLPDYVIERHSGLFPSFKTPLELSLSRIMHAHMLQRLFETSV